MPAATRVPKIRAMIAIRHVLVANEFASYRESVAAVLRAMTRGVVVFEAESKDLNREVVRLRPDLVICSRVTSLVRDRVPNWVELYPERTTSSTFYVDGEKRAMEVVELADLLRAVDLARPSSYAV